MHLAHQGETIDGGRATRTTIRARSSRPYLPDDEPESSD